MARQVEASVSSVFRWWQAYQRAGQRGLRSKPTPGRPPRLSEAQKRTLVKRLVRGPLRVGYRTDVWTLGRIAELIRQEFGIRYHPSHVWKVLTALGWSCQKPERRAVETRRGRHCPVEATRLAADKKTPHDVAPISSSSMRAAFC